MLADLKARAAAVDRKRVYTAAAALLIAGAAGHFMQQTSGGSTGPAVMSASVPSVSAPAILPANPGSGTPEIIAATPEANAPEIAPADAPAVPGTDDLAGAAPAAPDVLAPGTDQGMATATPTETPDITVPETVAAAPLTAPRPAPKPQIIPGTGTASTAIYPAPEANPVLEEVTRAASDPLLTITDPAPEPDKESVFASASDPLDLPPAAAVAPAEPEVAGCPLEVTGTALPGALLQINVTAPCNSGEAVAFQHSGLDFNEQLGPDGTLTVEVPAMTGTAVVTVDFADGTERELEVTVPDFDAFDRIAVIWQGPTGLQLHALEGGADYGETGHVWADTPGSSDAASGGSGGFLTALGSAAGGFAADVYTYPAALLREGVEPDVSIEAEVMENTCGGQIEGWILRTNPNGAPHAEPLTIKVPGCEAVGEFLVLKNLPVELKLVRR